jgi:hypothetical protein
MDCFRHNWRSYSLQLVKDSYHIHLQLMELPQQLQVYGWTAGTYTVTATAGATTATGTITFGQLGAGRSTRAFSNS